MRKRIIPRDEHILYEIILPRSYVPTIAFTMNDSSRESRDVEIFKVEYVAQSKACDIVLRQHANHINVFCTNSMAHACKCVASGNKK